MKYIEPLFFQLRKKVARLLFKTGEHIMPSVKERQFHFNNSFSLKQTINEEFPWRKYAYSESSFFAKWGIRVSQLDAAYYSYMSGIKADHYVSRMLMAHYLYPYLGRNEFVPAYMDKNIHKKVMRIKDTSNGCKIYSTVDLVYNVNGVYFDGQDNEISKEQAVEIIKKYNKEMIIKPSLDTYGGHGVEVVHPTKDECSIIALLSTYNQNFALQELVEQHPDLATFNSTSVNTIRIVTYRKPNKQRKVLYAVLRFGGAGAIKDNACSGGGHTGINLNDGTLRDRLIYQYHNLEKVEMPKNLPKQIPSWNKIVETVLFLHGYLPHFDVIGWDISVRPDGDLTLIEYNLRPDPELQDCVGPMFSIEELNELMEHVSKSQIVTHRMCEIRYNEMPDRHSYYTKYKI